MLCSSAAIYELAVYELAVGLAEPFGMGTMG